MEQIELMPARVRVAAILRKAILSGEFTRGQELSLTSLSTQLGVSRTPVREAFQALEGEGLLELRMNKGAIVRGIDEKFIVDHYEIRILLECEAVVRAARRRVDLSGVRRLHQEILARMPHVPPQEYAAYNQTLHTRIWQGADNQKLSGFLMGLWNGPSVGKTVSDIEHQRRSLEEHGEILTCIHIGEAEPGRRAMERHIRRSMENILASFSEG